MLRSQHEGAKGRSLSSRPTALVIGAGLGGITAAGLLARHGYEVKVLEKNPTPGGRCGLIVRDGHRFDIGPTLFLMREVFADTYAALGERMEDHLDLRKIDPSYAIHFDDGTKLLLTTNIRAMRPQVEAIEPGSFGGLLRYIAEGHRHYRLAVPRLAGRNFYHLGDYLNLQNLPLLLKLKALTKHYSNTRKYFRHPNLRAAFTFQDMYLGISPFDAPATYSLLQYTELVDGVWFPMGGMYRVIESLAAIARQLGARFQFNAQVERVEIRGGRATGVVLQDDSRIGADLVVANADLPYAYRCLLPDEAPANRLSRKKYTCSAIMFYWGVDRVYPQLGVHNLFMAGDYRRSFDRIFKERLLPDKPNFYVHAPGRIDSAASPDGHETLMVLVPAGRMDQSTRQDWSSLKSQARSSVMQRLERLGVSDLEQHLKFEICFTPQTWASLFNIAKGAAFGSLSHDILQVGYFRPHNRHRSYRNLYFVGASTHPGSGLPLALMSARLVTERILKENGSPHSSLRQTTG